jgi:hypothetical protein
VAAVPEVVPDENTLPDEERPVEMRGRVAGRRGQSNEQRGAEARQCSREDLFAARHDESGNGGGHHAGP